MNVAKTKNKKKFLELNNNGNVILYDQKESKQKGMKSAKDIKTPFEILCEEFPAADPELIEEMLDDNMRHLEVTRKQLQEIFKENIPRVQNQSETPSGYEVCSFIEDNSKRDVDLNNFAKFDFSDEEEDPRQKQRSIKPSKFCFTIKNLGSTPDLTNQEEFDVVESYSTFLEENNLELFLDILSSYFPMTKRQNILEALCNKDYDLEATLETLLENQDSDNGLDIDFLEINKADQEFLDNFKEYNIQSDIYKGIKKDNLKSQINSMLYSEDQFPCLDKEGLNHGKTPQDESELSENFLKKDIKDIKNKKIKEDLRKLIENFPFVDENDIKLLYYQFMSVSQTSNYLVSQGAKEDKKGKLHSLLQQNKAYPQQSKVVVDNNQFREVNNHREIKDNYNFYSNQNSEVISLRKINELREMMIKKISIAWRSGNKDGARKLLNEAKQERARIMEMMNNRKLMIECDNISHISKFNEVDLHGFTVSESKLIVSRKIRKIKEAYDCAEISHKQVVLSIITGKGNHSKNNSSILFPAIKEWVENAYPEMAKKFDYSRGIIALKCKII